jgi:amidohydrolase
MTFAFAARLARRSGPRPSAAVLLAAAVCAAGLPAVAVEPAPPDAARGVPAAVIADAKAWTDKELLGLIALYRHFHAHPELSLQEKETAEKFAAELRAAGCEVTAGVGGHGVVGLLKNGDGPTLLLRCDLDALPVVERTGLAYASTATATDPAGQTVGVMHACGHDVHMTSLIAAVRYLAGHRAAWRGTVVAIGQPAEERVMGAQAMLRDGLFERFGRPSFAIAMHVDAALPAGKVGVRAGYSLANSDSVDITVKGKGGHGAYPHMTIDPIVQAAELVMALQTIVSREIEPTEPAVITVGSIHGGTKHNVIGDSCKLELTVRSYSDAVRRQLHEAIERKAKSVAAGCGAPEPAITKTEGTAAVFNDRELATRIDGVFRKALGDDQVTVAERSMGAEDFSCFGRDGIPILMYRLGTIEPARLARQAQLGQPMPSLHSPFYYPDAEPTLATGALTMILAALELLGGP